MTIFSDLVGKAGSYAQRSPTTGVNNIGHGEFGFGGGDIADVAITNCCSKTAALDAHFAKQAELAVSKGGRGA